jgi:3-oxoadipate enol-lactonase
MPTVESAGASIYYETHGSGPAVVLAHGAGGNAMVWWQQVRDFARSHTVVTFDHRGYFRSHCAPEALDPTLFANDLAAILDDAKIERAALVGQSMGGFTVLAFALAHPERVRALVLCGTPGGVRTPLIDRDVAEIPRRASERGFTAMVLGPDFPTREHAKAFLFEQMNALNPPETLAALLPLVGRIRVSDDTIGKLGVPTLILGGTDDAFFSPAGLREVAGKVPGARFVEIPGAGHSTYFEVPELFNRTVREFLQAHVER